jgi:hypothetical protein
MSAWEMGGQEKCLNHEAKVGTLRRLKGPSHRFEFG